MPESSTPAKKSQPAKTAASPAKAGTPPQGLVGPAGDFAEAADKFAADTRKALVDLQAQADKLAQDHIAQGDEYAIMPAVRRVTGWSGDLERALEGLTGHSRELAQTTTDVTAGRDQG